MKSIAFATTLFLLIAAPALAQSTYKDLLRLACDSIPECVILVIVGIRTLAFPVAVIFIFYSGFLFVASQGSEEKIKNAKSTLTWALVGLAIIIGAEALARAFVDFYISL